MRRITLGFLVMTAALAGGCTGSGTAYYGGGGTLTATAVAPDLVYLSPGVQVVADYDYPVFYADNYYWRYDAGRWYRSSWYTGGWAYATPPYAVARIERPYAYRRYRPAGYVSRAPYVRDHRQYRAAPYRDTRPYYRDTRPVYRDTRPYYRDSRTYRRDAGPAVRDHRARPAPVYRDNRPAPAVRDHRSARPAPAYRESRPAPAARDHRSARPAPARDHRRPPVRDRR